jgi:hypothetical protein
MVVEVYPFTVTGIIVPFVCVILPVHPMILSVGILRVALDVSSCAVNSIALSIKGETETDPLFNIVFRESLNTTFVEVYDVTAIGSTTDRLLTSAS